jgi:hypothetical protein
MPAKVPEKKVLSRGEARIAKIQGERLASKTVARSAAHQGVVARPMDKQLSDILDRKRAEVRQQGTSAARLGQEEHETLLQANSEEDATNRSTSVGRLRTAEGEMGLQSTPKPSEPPDMAI